MTSSTKRLRVFRHVFEDTVSEWSSDRAPRLGAALAYYSVFSLVPLFVIVIALFGLLFGQEATTNYMPQQFGGILGEQNAEAIKNMIQRASQPSSGLITALVAFVTLMFGASGLFVELQDSLNTIWGVKPKEGRGIWGLIKNRFLSFMAVAGTAFLLFISLVVSAVLAVVGKWFGEWLPVPEFALQLLNLFLSTIVIACLFAMLFKVLPDAKTAWKDVWTGAFFTALLFTIGKFAIGLYLGKSEIGAPYGAAASFVILLVWVYYSAQIFLFGAEFTQVYAKTCGADIVPADEAVVIKTKKPPWPDMNHTGALGAEPLQRSWIRRIFARTALIGGLLVVVGAGMWLVNRELPAIIEHELNAHITGYRFTVGQATLSPTLSLEIRQLTMIQIEHPDPPVAEIPRWRFNIQWRHIFSGVLVSDYVITRPTFHITLPQAKKELDEDVPIHDKGWREAVYAFYPIKINELTIEDADVTYVDQDPSKPLHVTHLNLLAGNIRNIQSPNDAYPSDLKLDGNIFGSGRIEMQGHANFLADPYAGINADLALRQVALEPLLPVTGRYNVQIRGGLLSADGHLEFTAKAETTAILRTLTIEHARVDYVHSPDTTVREAQVGRAAVMTAKTLQNKPSTLIRIDHGEIKNSDFGFVNKTANPPYRVFLTKGALHLNNITNHLSEGSGLVTLTGAFMGTGNTVISGTFRPETTSPDFDLNVKIERTQLRPMNNLLRAYGNFDVTAGLFSMYSELRVKNGRIAGYIKPLFRDMTVYDTRQEKEKNLFHKLYEGLVGDVAKLLENKPREEVATLTEISGALEDPETSTWQTVINLVKNAFFKAILPGFEHTILSQS